MAPCGAQGLDYFAGMGQVNVEDIRLYLDDPGAAREQSRQERDQLLATTPEGFLEGFASPLSPVDGAWMTRDVAADVAADIRVGLEPGDEGWWDDGVEQLSPVGCRPLRHRCPGSGLARRAGPVRALPPRPVTRRAHPGR